MVFVDDRLRNVAAADAFGMRCVLYNPAPEESRGHKFAIARTFDQLLNYLFYQGNQDSLIDERERK